MAPSKKLTVWLADLVHIGVSVFESVPLNLGYLASALHQTYPGLITTKLFKYPDKLFAALKKEEPDILAFSNYTWNFYLSLHFAGIAKELYPNLIIVMGGPNIRIDKEGIYNFLKKVKNVDVYIPLESESSFCSLIGQILKQGKPSNLKQLYAQSREIPGCYFSIENYNFSFIDYSQTDTFLKYDSPYLTGILDEFIKDPRLAPIFETARGCPYGCTYCAWGIAALGKLRVKKIDQVIKEFYYVAENSAGQNYWYFADSNFGIYDYYLELAQVLRKIRDTYSFPKQLNISWSKNSGNRLLKITKTLQDMVPSQIAVQSLDKEVLKKINRKNLDDEDIQRLNKEFHEQGSIVATDILVGCSGESLTSHLKTLRAAFQLDFDEININNIRLLPGSKMETEEERQKYGFITKFRLIPNSYGFYNHKFVFEIEEAIKASNTLTEEEMDQLKGTHFLVYLLWNSTFAKPLLKLGFAYNLNPLDIFLVIEKDQQSEISSKILLPLIKAYNREWFSTEKEIIEHYSKPEIYRDILSGKLSSEKLTWKFMSQCLYEKEIIYQVIDKVSQIIKEQTKVPKKLLEIVQKISKDRLKLDLTQDIQSNKDISYECSEPDFKKIKELGIIPPLTFFDGKQFTLNYYYRLEDSEHLNKILQRFNYEKKPITALCAALSYRSYSGFIYQMVK